jgi:hypothetical protein
MIADFKGHRFEAAATKNTYRCVRCELIARGGEKWEFSKGGLFVAVSRSESLQESDATPPCVPD